MPPLTALACLLALSCARGVTPEPVAEPTPEPAPEPAPPPEPVAEPAPEPPPPPTWLIQAEETEQIGGRDWQKITLESALTDDRGAALTGASPLWVYTPPGADEAPILLGLPGWKFEALTWERHAQVSDLALRYGVRVALANMHTTIYESRFYPETNASFRWCGPGCQVPGAVWVGELLLPYLATRGELAGLFGLSTGGRGAVLVPQLYPEAGVARACSMSGTFDLQSLVPGSGEYQIHQVIYGARDASPERWSRDDSHALLDALEGLSVLLIHGGLDTDVPPAQSEGLHRAMQAKGWSSELVIEPQQGHSWALWAGSLERCFAFLTAG